MEIHTIELHQKLLNKPIDEWIQVFNAKTEEELDMIRSKERQENELGSKA